MIENDQGYKFAVSEDGEVLCVFDRNGKSLGKPAQLAKDRPGLGTYRFEMRKASGKIQDDSK